MEDWVLIEALSKQEYFPVRSIWENASHTDTCTVYVCFFFNGNHVKWN